MGVGLSWCACQEGLTQPRCECSWQKCSWWRELLQHTLPSVERDRFSLSKQRGINVVAAPFPPVAPAAAMQGA